MLDYTYKAYEPGIKEKNITQVNPNFHILTMGANVLLTCEEVEIDEQWSFVKNKSNQRWIKRLTRKIICFSKSEKMHDIVIGLLINKIEFNGDIYA